MVDIDVFFPLLLSLFKVATLENMEATASIVGIQVDGGALSFSFPVNGDTTVKELIFSLIQRTASLNSNSCANYSLFEVTSEYGGHLSPFGYFSVSNGSSTRLPRAEFG